MLALPATAANARPSVEPDHAAPAPVAAPIPLAELELRREAAASRSGTRTVLAAPPPVARATATKTTKAKPRPPAARTAPERPHRARAERTTQRVTERAEQRPRRPVVRNERAATPRRATKKNRLAATARSGGRNSVVAFALSQVGKPYRYGSNGPNAWDCSGLTQAAWKTAGVRLPHSSGGQAGRGKRVAKSQGEPGDVVVMNGHVGIYLGGGKMVHAPQPGRRVEVTKINWGSWSLRRPG